MKKLTIAICPIVLGLMSAGAISCSQNTSGSNSEQTSVTAQSFKITESEFNDMYSKVTTKGFALTLEATTYRFDRLSFNYSEVKLKSDGSREYGNWLIENAFTVYSKDATASTGTWNTETLTTTVKTERFNEKFEEFSHLLFPSSTYGDYSYQGADTYFYDYTDTSSTPSKAYRYTYTMNRSGISKIIIASQNSSDAQSMEIKNISLGAQEITLPSEATAQA